MPTGTSGRDFPPDPRKTLVAFGRVLYTDIVSVVVLSLLFSFSALFVVTLGAGLLALTETMTAIVTGENRGGPETERERVALFWSSFRRHLVTGLPISAVVLITVVTIGLYSQLTLSGESPVFVLGLLLGLYAAVIVPVWLFRTASVLVRAPVENAPRFRDAARDAAYLCLDWPSFTVLHLVAVAGLWILTAGTFVITVPILLVGMLALLEVIVFEEITRDKGAHVIHAAYRGNLTPSESE